MSEGNRLPVAAISGLRASSPTILSDSKTMNETYESLTDRLENIFKEPGRLSEGEQFWVAIAGGPGAGKTTTAASVAERFNRRFQETYNENICVVLPMDGFHYSKKELQELDPPNGESFLRRRGAPWTMNAELCFEQLHQARVNRCATLPTYSREISDPVPGGVSLLKSHRIVLVEGLYLLWDHDPRWKPLQELWDERWFLKCPIRDVQRERLIHRSLKTWSEAKAKVWGAGREGVVARVDANDSLNMDIVAESEQYADVIIHSI